MYIYPIHHPYIPTPIQEAMMNLLVSFRNQNGVIPSHIIVYRDGVAEG